MRIFLVVILFFNFHLSYAAKNTDKLESKGIIESIDLELRSVIINREHFILVDKLIVRDKLDNIIDQGILKPGYFISFSASEDHAINSITIQSQLNDHVKEH